MRDEQKADVVLVLSAANVCGETAERDGRNGNDVDSRAPASFLVRFLDDFRSVTDSFLPSFVRLKYFFPNRSRKFWSSRGEK